MLRGFLYSVLSGISFGFLPVFGKLAYGAGMDVRMILMSRFLPAAVLFGLWLALTDRRLLRPGPRTLPKAAALGMLFYPLQSSTSTR
jgi:drug/metabolite transporter (DMT)-like permease